MLKLVLALFIISLSAGAEANVALKKGQNVNITDGGWVCRSMEKAIASRIIGPFEKAKESDAIYQLNNGSCIDYSIRPLKVLGYEDYLIPGYPEKGKLFVSVREPRSGEVWYAFIGYL
ncbi:hypothetical protein RAC90_05310 [Pantoea sp. CS_6]|uniref:hypothetical protein n=1 Tax=Pantoea sp. CS_6 TaxID=3055795 RepID=UPI0035BF6D38